MAAAHRMKFLTRPDSRGGLHSARFFAFFMFCVCLSHPSLAQQPANLPAAPVTGVIRTSEGTPVPGATVRRVATETNKVWLSWTDESGKFEFPQITAGHYRVEATQLGFVQASLLVEIPIVPPGPVPIVLRVATLAELPGAPAANPHRGAQPSANRAPNGQNGASNSANASGSNAQGSRRGNGGGQLPAGVTNAVREGLAGGGFEQTDLTGEGTNPQTVESNGPANGTPQTEAALSTNAGANSSATSDSFLLQGTVGQGLLAHGAGGSGGLGGLLPGTPGDQQGARGGGGRGPGQLFGQGGGAGGFGGQGGAGGGPGGGPGGGGGGRGRLGRQTVNRVRFSFYDRYENSAFDARPFSITGNEVPKPSHYDERFGGHLGGPLKIPHIYNGSDKTYFFVNYQHEVQSSALDNYSTVPTAAERSGDFCGLGVTIFNPFSNFSGPRTPLGNGCQIPTINSAAAGLLAFYPQAHLRGTVQNFLLQTTVPINSDILNFHVLHTINSKFSLNGGYNLSSTRENTFGNFLSTAGTESILNQSVTLGLSHNWTAHLVENTQLNWSRSRTQILSDNSFKANVAGALGITGVSTDPMTFGIPAISFSSLSGLNDPLPSLVRNQTLRLGDSLKWVHAKHTFTFGGEIRRIQLNADSNPQPRGRFNFTGVLTSQLDAAGQPVHPPPGTQQLYELG